MFLSKYSTLYFLDDSKVFRETWRMLSNFSTFVAFESVEEFKLFLAEDAEAKLKNSIVVTDLRFAKESIYDGTDALFIVRQVSAETPVFLSTTGIMDKQCSFTGIIDKNPRKGIEQITSIVGD